MTVDAVTWAEHEIAHRAEPRLGVTLTAVAVLAAGDGPLVLRGETTDISRGGCRLLLDESPLRRPRRGTPVVVSVTVDDEPIPHLGRVIDPDGRDRRELRVMFVEDRRPTDDRWTALVARYSTLHHVPGHQVPAGVGGAEVRSAG